MLHEIVIKDLSGLESAASQFVKEIGNNKIIAFFAPMGAGKTTFSSAVCKYLGVAEDEIASPTFAIVNEYVSAEGEPIYHFDFYRIDDPTEALDIGFYDYIDSGALCLMEWAENIEPIIPEDALRVTISVNDDESRLISWQD